MIKRVAVALLLVVLALAAYAGWYIYGAWPVPRGYAFPRHSIWGGGPLALFDGSLHADRGCIRTDGSDSATVVWPPGYRLVIEDGKPVVHGGARPIRMGQTVRMGGGWYGEEHPGSPAPTAFDVDDCPAPYFLSTGLIDD